MQNLYEVLLIVAPEADDNEINAVIGDLRTTIDEDGGTVLQAGVWERRKLAYEVKGKTEGIYVLMHADGNGTLPAALKDRMRLDESVIRSLVVRLEDKHEADVRAQIAESAVDSTEVEAQRVAAERRAAAAAEVAAMSLDELVAAETEAAEEAEAGEVAEGDVEEAQDDAEVAAVTEEAVEVEEGAAASAEEPATDSPAASPEELDDDEEERDS